MKYVLTLFIVLFLSACATKESGFLPSYEGLKKVDTNLYFAQAKDANLSAYDKLYIPEVQVRVNTDKATPAEHKLSIEIKAYATTAYRKLIAKKSANYKLVDIGQKDTIVMQIALSLAKIDKSKKGLDAIEFLPFSSYEESEKLHLVVEVKTTDVMSSKLLARSVKIIMDEDVNATHLNFRAIQASLDAWLSGVVKH